ISRGARIVEASNTSDLNHFSSVTLVVRGSKAFPWVAGGKPFPYRAFGIFCRFPSSFSDPVDVAGWSGLCLP
ncbi:MAG: hypothetical protein ACK58L_15920, partial [Planctomycetota bacterium]